jgi:hypothetical protein
MPQVMQASHQIHINPQLNCKFFNFGLCQIASEEKHWYVFNFNDTPMAGGLGVEAMHDVFKSFQSFSFRLNVFFFKYFRQTLISRYNHQAKSSKNPSMHRKMMKHDSCEMLQDVTSSYSDALYPKTNVLLGPLGGLGCR